MGADSDLTPAPAPDLVPELAPDPADLGAWRLVAASAAGEAHARMGMPCQDACRVDVVDGIAIIAVADGAGSAARADQGAAAAATAAVAALRRQIERERPRDEIGWTECISQALAEARAAVEDLASRHDLPARDFATTLACVACDPDWLAACQIGDGLVVMQPADGELQTVLRPERGEYANETTFLVEPDALSRAQYHVQRAQMRAVAVMTDGLLRLAAHLPDHLPHAGFFQPLFTFARSNHSDDPGAALATFLASERVAARTDDDRTLVLAVRVTR